MAGREVRGCKQEGFGRRLEEAAASGGSSAFGDTCRDKGLRRRARGTRRRSLRRDAGRDGGRRIWGRHVPWGSVRGWGRGRYVPERRCRQRRNRPQQSRPQQNRPLKSRRKWRKRKKRKKKRRKRKRKKKSKRIEKTDKAVFWLSNRRQPCCGLQVRAA